MNKTNVADIVWQQYINALKRLETLIEDQAYTLSEEDWDHLTSIMGKIENSKMHLKNSWELLSSSKGSHLKKGSKDNLADNDKGEAKAILTKLLSMNKKNEELLRKEMEQLKINMSVLKKTRKSHKKYITQKQIEEFSPLDVNG